MQLTFLSIIACLISTICSAQVGARIGYIDMEYILSNVPEYAEANAQLEKKIVDWRQEIEVEKAAIEEIKKELASEKVLLTKELIEEREEDIFYKEKELIEYQQKRFGASGDLVRYKQSLVQPVQDQVFNSVQEIAKAKKFDFVFEKSSGGASMLYSADRYDISDLVLRSITRAAKRVEIKGRQAKAQLERDEKNTIGQDKELQARQLELDKKQAAREKLIADKKRQRDSLRQKKIKEYEARRNELLALRKKKKDSLESLKKSKTK